MEDLPLLVAVRGRVLELLRAGWKLLRAGGKLLHELLRAYPVGRLSAML